MARCHLGVLVALLTIGCGATVTLTRPLSAEDRVTLATVEAQDWLIRSSPHDGDRPTDEWVSRPRVYGDLLHCTSADGRPRQVPIEALQSIHLKTDHLRGAFEGAGFGFLAGASLGAVGGFSRGSDPPQPHSSDCGPCSLSAGAKAAIGGVIGGVLGLGTGLIVGAIVGHREAIELR